MNVFKCIFSFNMCLDVSIGFLCSYGPLQISSSCSDHCATVGLFIYITLTGDTNILKLPNDSIIKVLLSVLKIL